MATSLDAARNRDATMKIEQGTEFGFAVAHDAPIRYLERIRDYYAALGYGAPYEWAHYAEVPFQPLDKPLARSRVAIITTAAPYQSDKGDQGPGAPYNAAVKFYSVYSGDTSKDHDLRISHVAIDRKHTTAEDSASYFPLPELRKTAATARIGSVAPRFHGAPTNRSHRVTLGIDCPEIVARCKADEVDAAILVPNCPVCHQTVSLAARALEESEIATVVMGCAKDIVEHVGVPRLLFSDFPLGNAAGRPNDPVSQAFTLDLALRILETAPAPRTTVQSPLTWTASPDWKLDYCNIDRLTPEEIRRRRAEFDRGKAQAANVRKAAGLTRSDAADEIA
jgi:D-proline reductase (dithiol) PrdB